MPEMSGAIHPTALIEPGARLGAGCTVMAHAVITRHCELGDGVVVHPFAVVGGDPQYLKFDPATASGVRIGAGAVIREHVTVNRSIHAGGWTTVGAGAFLMAASHVGHDCEVGDHVVLANAVLLAGHVAVGAHTFLGGGAGAPVLPDRGGRDGGGPRVADPGRPAFRAGGGAGRGHRPQPGGVAAALAELKRAFQAVYFTPGNIREVAAARRAGGDFGTPEARRFLEFFAGGRRSFARARRAEAEEIE